MKIGDKINVAIAFLNDDERIEKENIFAFNNVEVGDVNEFDNHVFVLKKIKDMKPVNRSDFIPLTGYELCVRDSSANLIDYAMAYRCYFMFSYNRGGNDLINDLLQYRIKELNHEIEEEEHKLKALVDDVDNIKKIMKERDK